jgi:hypothetical protein
MPPTLRRSAHSVLALKNGADSYKRIAAPGEAAVSARAPAPPGALHAP